MDGIRSCSKDIALQRTKAEPKTEMDARFEREVVPLREPVYRHALRMCRNHSDAKDLVQDAMVKAYSSFHSFTPHTNLNAWLHRIQTNTYINGYRRKQRRPIQYSTEEFTEQQLAAHTWMGLRSAEDEVLAALPDCEIKAAMRALPIQLRSVVYYADVEGFRYKQIAEIMGTPNGTVMSRLYRGRRHLRRLLVEQVVR